MWSEDVVNSPVEACPRCGEQERLGRWCGACGTHLEDLDGTPDVEERAARWPMVLISLGVLLIAAVAGLLLGGLIDLG